MAPGRQTVPLLMSYKTRNLTACYVYLATQCSLLSGDSQCSAGSSSGLSLLASDLDSPEMPESSVGSDLLQSLQVLSQLRVEGVGDQLRPGSVSDVSLSVQEPFRDVVISGSCKNIIDFFQALLLSILQLSC